MEYFNLNDGNKLPALICGTNSYGHEASNFMSPWNHDYSPVIKSVKAGFRCFDTAAAYRNEEGIGLALKDCGVSRDELVIIGKLKVAPGNMETGDLVKENFKKSLKKLKLDYMDYYLIHRPWDNEDQICEAWLALNDMVKEGLLKGMALSNFSPEKVDMLTERTNIKPAFNQYCYNSIGWKDKWIEEFAKRGIASMAWASLTLSPEMKTLISGLAPKYNKSWAQIMLRHNYQKGLVSVCKSHSYEHSLESLDIFDFELSTKDMNAIDDFIPKDPLIKLK